MHSIQHYVTQFVSDSVEGRFISPGTPVSSTNKTDRHDIAEIMLKVTLNTITVTSDHMYKYIFYDLDGVLNDYFFHYQDTPRDQQCHPHIIQEQITHIHKVIKINRHPIQRLDRHHSQCHLRSINTWISYVYILALTSKWITYFVIFLYLLFIWL